MMIRAGFDTSRPLRAFFFFLFFFLQRNKKKRRKFFIYLFIYVFIFLSIYLFICLFIYLFIYLLIYLFLLIHFLLLYVFDLLCCFSSDIPRPPQRCSLKKGVLKIFQNSQGNTCVGVFFLIILQASHLQIYQK